MKIGTVEPKNLANYAILAMYEKNRDNRIDYISILALGREFGVSFHSEKKRDNNTTEISECHLAIVDTRKAADAIVSVLTSKRKA